MYNALAIANHFVVCARDSSVRDLTPLKLHGLTYCAQGWHLRLSGKPLIEGRVAAHRDGVFIPELREAGCWGAKALTEPVAVLRMDERRGVMIEQKPTLAPAAPVKPLLDWVWKTYGKLPLYELSKHINVTGGPWDLVWNDEGRTEDEARVIPAGAIRQWFQKLGTKEGADTSEHRLSRTQRLEAKLPPESAQRLLTKPDSHKLRTT